MSKVKVAILELGNIGSDQRVKLRSPISARTFEATGGQEGKIVDIAMEIIAKQKIGAETR